MPTAQVLGFEVQRLYANKDGFLEWAAVNELPSTEAEILDTSMTSGGTYTYRVRTVDTSDHASHWSENADAVVTDGVPPGKVVAVFAEPDRVAGSIIVTWKKGADPDVESFRVYRAVPSTREPQEWVPGSNGTALPVAEFIGDPIPANNGPSYTFIDINAIPGRPNYYAVAAVDSEGNSSVLSRMVVARPRVASEGPPVIVALNAVTQTIGAPSTDGTPAGDMNGADVTAEDDDIVAAQVQWTATSDLANGYKIYRQASDEAHFTKVATVAAGTYVFLDTTVTKSQYSYFVAGTRLVNGYLEETAGAVAPTLGGCRFLRELPLDTSVRNLVVYDGRNKFSTYNRESRMATISWSRIPEPGLAGYNVYRMCSFWHCEEGAGVFTNNMDAFSCAPEWVRLNAKPVPPEQREFGDATTGGLQGCYLYAVRPIDSTGREGPITKVAFANLWAGQDDPINYPLQVEKHTHAATYLYSDDPQQGTISAVTSSPRGSY